MAAMLGGGDGALGGLPIEQWWFEMPAVTRWWTTATVITGVLVQCHVLTPFQLFYSFRAVFNKSQVGQPVERTKELCILAEGYADMVQQYWRLISTFIYFGPLSLNLLFHIFFIQRYARMLEESAASVAHFSWLMAYAATTLLMIAPLFNQAFLGTTLSSTLVYIWSRRNPDVRLSFLGILTFKAPWLPWVLIAFNVVLHSHWPKDELCGIVVGHSEQTVVFVHSIGRMLTDAQSGTSSTTSTRQHTTATDRWTRRSGGSGFSNETRYLRQTQMSSTQQRSIETSRSQPCLKCGSEASANEMQRSFFTVKPCVFIPVFFVVVVV